MCLDPMQSALICFMTVQKETIVAGYRAFIRGQVAVNASPRNAVEAEGIVAHEERSNLLLLFLLFMLLVLL